MLSDALATGFRMRWSQRHANADAAYAPAGTAAGRVATGGPGMPGGKHPGGARRHRWFDALFQDLRFARRSLASSPGFAAVAIVTLGLGIGANTAIFTVVDSVLLRDLPYAEPERLVLIDRTSTRSSVTAASWPDFRDWRDEVTLMTGLAGQVHFSTDVRWEGETQNLNGAAITHDLSRSSGWSLRWAAASRPKRTRSAAPSR